MGSALVVIDMLNTYDFPDADKLVPSAAERATCGGPFDPVSGRG